MKITLAQQKHISSAAEILCKAYYSSRKEALNSLKTKLKSKEVLVAIDKGDVIGVLVYTRHYSHYANYIEDIAVSLQHRRKGVASALLQKYTAISKKEQPKKQKYALSSTTVDNEASVKLHKKFGFVILGRIKKLHYGRDELLFGYKL